MERALWKISVRSKSGSYSLEHTVPYVEQNILYKFWFVLLTKSKHVESSVNSNVAAFQCGH